MPPPPPTPPCLTASPRNSTITFLACRLVNTPLLLLHNAPRRGRNHTHIAYCILHIAYRRFCFLFFTVSHLSPQGAHTSTRSMQMQTRALQLTHHPDCPLLSCELLQACGHSCGLLMACGRRWRLDGLLRHGLWPSVDTIPIADGLWPMRQGLWPLSLCSHQAQFKSGGS